MNSKIQQFIDQATTTVLDCPYSVTQFDKEKFASLIIAECINVCNSQREPTTLNYSTNDRYVEAIEQHFNRNSS